MIFEQKFYVFYLGTILRFLNQILFYLLHSHQPPQVVQIQLQDLYSVFLFWLVN